MKEYIEVYTKDGELKKYYNTGFILLVLALWIFLPIMFLIVWIHTSLFTKRKWITKEDYYKEKIKELRR